MEWLKNLPLDDISERLAGFFIWWANLVKDVPDDQLPLLVYTVGVVSVLLLWLLVMRILPRPIKGISWAFLAALLIAPGKASGESGEIAPAIVGVFHSILMKDYATMMMGLLPILATFAAFLFIGAIWQMLRSVISGTAAKEQETARIKEQKRLMAEAEQTHNG